MDFDFQLFQLINHFAGKISFIDDIVVLFTKYGPLLFGFILLGFWFSKKGEQMENRKTVLLAVATAGIALGINQLIGAIYFRPRPFAGHAVTLLLDKSTDPSFPSDHATGAFALALAVFWKNRKLGYGMLVMAFFLAISRVYAGTHYPLGLTRIVSHLCYDRIEKRKKEGYFTQETLRENTPSSMMEHVQLRLNIEEAMQKISPEQREVIVLRDVQGFTYDEMADILQIPVGTVKSRIHAARLALRNHLEKEGR